MIKKTAKKLLLPFRNLIYTGALLFEYLKDFNRYRKYSQIDILNSSQTRMRAAILMRYHGFEKGLAMLDPRVNFGQQKLSYLLNLTECYINKFGMDSVSQMTIEALWAYMEWNQRKGNNLRDLRQFLLTLCPNLHTNNKELAGIESVTKKSILEDSKIDLLPFLKARHSIRNFGPESVDTSIIKKAVHMALHTPSVCNRQPWRVHIFSDKLKDQVITCQKGNSGFGHLADKVIIITSELQSFFGKIERNEAGIDGGMFAMSLVYSLHSQGLGTCCLAWTVESKNEYKLRRLTKIPESETIVMLMLVGHLPDRLRVAKATRLDIDQILTIYT